jgi:hypothetical protein
MRIPSLLAGMAFLIAVAFPAFAHKDDDTAPVSGNLNARKVLLGAVKGLANQGNETIGMVAEGLTGLWEEDSPERDNILIALLDYQVRGVSGEFLAEMITARGRAILPILKARLDDPPACEEEFLDGCRTRDERDPLIEELIEAIDIGEVLCIDIEKCLVRTARSMASPPFRHVLNVVVKSDKPITGAIEGTADTANTVVGSLAGDEKSLADLLDYNLGPTMDGLVDKEISRLGEDAVGELDKAFLAPLVCHPLYTNICVVNQEARNKRIERLKGAIVSGEIICPEGEADCAKE